MKIALVAVAFGLILSGVLAAADEPVLNAAAEVLGEPRADEDGGLRQDAVITVMPTHEQLDVIEDRELGCQLAPYKQCAGKNFRGSCRTCPSGFYCKYINKWWSGCQKMASAQGVKSPPSPRPPSYPITPRPTPVKPPSSPPPPPPPPQGPRSSNVLPSYSYSVSAPGDFSSPVRGQSTYYGIVEVGNCGFDQAPSFRPNWMQQSATAGTNDPNKFWPVAVDPTIWKSVSGIGASACGMCLVAKLDSNQQQYYGYFSDIRFGVIYDQCPECGRGAIDWRGQGNGRFNHEWIAIECPVDQSSQTNFVYYTAVCSPTYFKFQVRNSRVPIRNGRMRFQGKGWQNADFAPDGDSFYVVRCSGFCTDPFDIELTSVFGEIQTDYGIKGTNAVTYGGAQFSSYRN